MRRLLRPAVLAYLVCVASGVSVAFSFWPYRAGFVAYFVLVPFVIFSGLRDGAGRFLLKTYLFGLGYFGGSLYWIAMLDRDQIALPWLRVPAAAVLCLYLALFILLAGWLTRRLVVAGVPFEIAFALAWAGAEYLRSLGPLGFPWASLGYSQTSYPVVAQQAAVVGTYGISAWLVLLNALLARALTSPRARFAVVAAAVAVFAAPVAGGWVVLSQARCPESVRVSLIQPNISGAVKWDEAYRDSTLGILLEMSDGAGEAGETGGGGAADLIVWPETAVPLYVKYSQAHLEMVAEAARRSGASLLTGFPDYEHTNSGTRYYNSAMLVSAAGRIEGEYRKIHLVPFGEMIPFEQRIAFLRNINFGEGDFSPGTAYHIFQADSVPFGVAICFESIFPNLVRGFVGRGARFIVNITNDEWFGPSAGPYQHAEMAVMRCVEHRVAMARCANTGVSMLIDPYGRVVRRTSLFAREVLAGSLPVTASGTPYTRWAGLIEAAFLGLPLAGAVVSYVRPRGSRGRGGRDRSRDQGRGGGKGFDTPAAPVIDSGQLREPRGR
ncbi:MAG: apolipoprotein N-acyltransferase [bacterium]